MSAKKRPKERIDVQNVYCDHYREGQATPDFTEKVIAFEVAKGKLVGITTDEDFCERQQPQYSQRYYGKA